MTGPFIVREATESDVDSVRSLKTPIVGLSPRREEEIVSGAITTHDCLVCVDSVRAVIGYVILAKRSFFGRDFVRLLEVSEHHRRRGVATTLLSSALARCTSATVFTSTNESNNAMRSLLAREGWIFSGALTGIDEGDPEFVFWNTTLRAQ